MGNKVTPTSITLEKEMVAHSSILAWEIPWTEEPARLQSVGSQLDMTWRLNNIDKHQSKDLWASR